MPLIPLFLGVPSVDSPVVFTSEFLTKGDFANELFRQTTVTDIGVFRSEEIVKPSFVNEVFSGNQK